MKRIVGLLAVLLLSLAVILPVAAAEPLYAEALYCLGLVEGYGTGGDAPDFGLSDKLTRAQAVVQVIRFLGAENAVKGTEYPCPFEDVPAWAASYIGYAYANGITGGRSATRFDPDGQVDAPQFLTLMLRAIGYSDADGDFVWSSPYTLSDRLGITAGAVAPFSRGDAFKICWLTLLASAKNGRKVSDALMEQKVFDADAYAQAARMAEGNPIVVACVGDSLTQGTGTSDAGTYSYPARLGQLLGKGYQVVNCGKAGAYVMDPAFEFNAKSEKPELWYPNTAAYATALRSNADVMIVQLGTNDVRSMTNKKSRTQFISDFKKLMADFTAMPSKPKIYLSYAFPAVNVGLTYEGTTAILPDLIREIGKELDLPVLPLGDDLKNYYMATLPYNDRIHPTNVTYGAAAQYIYNHVFGGNAVVDSIPQTEVVFVSDYGTMSADGASDKTPVRHLAHAVGKLSERGGTVVVCGPLTESFGVIPQCGGNVTVTSVYGGVDYAKTAGAKLILRSSLFSESALTFENITLHAAASGQGIYMQYHDLTIGEGVVCTADPGVTVPLSLNAGYTVQLAGTATEKFDCTRDCTITVNSGTWSILRGGNKRAKPEYAVASTAAGTKLSIIVSGGEFVATGSANTATGQNDMRGELYVEINGGSFASPFYVFSRIGTNTAGDVVYADGRATVKVTGGDFKAGFYAVYPNGGITPKNKIALTLSEEMRALTTDSRFVISHIDE